MSKSEQEKINQRANYISSLMQNGYTNKEARDRADNKIDVNPPSVGNCENIDRSRNSHMQDWASQESDF